MKNILVFITFIFLSFAAQAQSGKVVSVAIDTVQGNETIYLTTADADFVKGAHITLQALCTQTGGISDGTITIEGSLDGVSYVNLSNYANLMSSSANDTLTIVNGSVVVYTIKENPFRQVRLKVAGTSVDSTKITVKYNFVR